MRDHAGIDGPTKRWQQILDSWDSIAARIELCERYVRDSPEDGPAWSAYGLGLSQVSRFDEAERAIRRALELAPERTRVFLYCEMGQICSHRGDLTSGEKWYQKAIAADPGNAQGYIYLGAMLSRSGRLVEAEGIHRRGTTCKSGCVHEAFLNLGLVLRAQRRYAEAITCFEEAIRRDPHYKQAKIALRDCRRAIRIVSSPEASDSRR